MVTHGGGCFHFRRRDRELDPIDVSHPKPSVTTRQLATVKMVVAKSLKVSIIW